MKFVVTLERGGFASIAAGLLALCASIASLSVDDGADLVRASAGLETNRSRLEAASVVRRDPRRDEQFDAIIGSIAAGLGTDAPSEIAEPIAMILRGRARERSRPARDRIADPDVERGLAAAQRALGWIEANGGRRPRGTKAIPLATALAGTLVCALGVVALAVAYQLRRIERRTIGALCSVPAAVVHSGRLAVDVGRTLALARAGPPVIAASQSPTASAPPRPRRDASQPRPAARAVQPRPPSQPDVASVTSAVGNDSAFGRILEITAVED